MNGEKFTQKSIEVINGAQNIAREHQNQTLTPEHMLAALLNQEGGLIGTLLYRLGVDVGAMQGEVNSLIEKQPKVQGVTELYPSGEVSAVLRFAEKAHNLSFMKQETFFSHRVTVKTVAHFKG